MCIWATEVSSLHLDWVSRSVSSSCRPGADQVKHRLAWVWWGFFPFSVRWGKSTGHPLLDILPNTWRRDSASQVQPELGHGTWTGDAPPTTLQPLSGIEAQSGDAEARPLLSHRLAPARSTPVPTWQETEAEGPGRRRSRLARAAAVRARGCQ